jgi:hypothetical protein
MERRLWASLLWQAISTAPTLLRRTESIGAESDFITSLHRKTKKVRYV